ncbi:MULTISPECIES: single-stranded DNA-binding protein [Lactococcus]|jgi:single-strand DNA-binding protein|uniref:Single-stranded DNA-binding protein n=1 Tax=Lactococcus formosensis TaxID=1281486 RepID=A0A9Q8Y3X9_9LACT|nr:MULTISPECIES: single-stranded DNA-binding protein [Lactococcus]USI66598.1 single-stranded DNA-binding protein [Lactococcus petauri]USI69043.1 single-stranded DNA-binding protein [Lactococcus petauri]USJ21230.1 single-stranded DNA-binding protein [Lactococcus formosensis]WJE13709.1 single-stranded DNA-binding protein [Lactococcus petauri]
MINNVTLVGRLVRDPELRYTPQNTAVATFTIAVNRRFKNAQGEREADFINCVIWRQSAENLANWAKKGALIGVTGSIQVRNYENKEGRRVYVTEVLADNFQMLESRATREGGHPAAPAAQNTTPGKTGTPDFGRNSDPFGGEPMEISDDDLPF